MTLQAAIKVVGQTIEGGEPALLVSIDGEHPEPMSKAVIGEVFRSIIQSSRMFKKG